MEGINIPVNYVAIHIREYEDMKEDSFILIRLLPVLLDGIIVRDHYDPKATEPWIGYDDGGILDLLKAVCPDEYVNTVDEKINRWKAQKIKEAKEAAEAKGEEAEG